MAVVEELATLVTRANSRHHTTVGSQCSLARRVQDTTRLSLPVGMVPQDEVEGVSSSRAALASSSTGVHRLLEPGHPAHCL